MRRSRQQEPFSQRAKLFFAETDLFKNLAKSSGRECPRRHCDVSLPSIWMAKALTLSCFYESSANQSCEDLTGGVGHREFRPERSKTSFRQERFRRASASLRPTLQSILERQRWLLRYHDREWLSRESECGRNNSPEIQVRLWAQEGRSNAS
jgi:hypothetical protein